MTGTEVRFACDDDEQAAKIAAVLEALGCVVTRDLSGASAETRRRWGLRRFVLRHMLTEREESVLVATVLRGQSNGEAAAALEISSAMIKWHLHSIMAKSGTNSREELLRKITGVSA